MVRERSRMHLGPYESGTVGTARRVDDRLGRMPHGLDIVLMQVVDECRVIPLGPSRWGGKGTQGSCSRSISSGATGIDVPVCVLATQEKAVVFSGRKAVDVTRPSPCSR